MEIQKIISALKGENELMLFNPSTGEMEIPEMLNETDRSFYDAHIAAIEELEMRVPKKPEKNYLGQNICPECQEKILVHYDFCAACGQAIDWGK